MVVEGGGYVLNNRMPYFGWDEDDVNVLVPGKRTRHTVNPALAMKNGKPYLAWNTPGGDNQPQAMLQAFLNVVVFDMNIQQAVEAATVRSTALGAAMYPQTVGDGLVVPKVLADRIGEDLAAKGHRIEVRPMQPPYEQQPSGAGAVKMVMVDSERGVLMGGSEPGQGRLCDGLVGLLCPVACFTFCLQWVLSVSIVGASRDVVTPESIPSFLRQDSGNHGR